MTRLSSYARTYPPLVLPVVVALLTISSSFNSVTLDIGRHAYYASAFPQSSMIIATSTTRSTQSSSPPHLTMMMPSSVFRPQTRGRRTIHRSSSSSSTRRPFSSPVVVVGRTGRVAESFASTTTNSSTGLHSFFGLGPAEATIILVAGLFVLGPSKLLEYSRGIGEMTGKSIDGVGDEWRDGLSSIPEEFRKGLEEGEIDARGRKAKRMDDVDE